MATSENLEDWESITLYGENKYHLEQISDVSEGFRRLPYIRLATVLSFISYFSSAVGEAIIKLIEAMY